MASYLYYLEGIQLAQTFNIRSKIVSILKKSYQLLLSETSNQPFVQPPEKKNRSEDFKTKNLDTVKRNKRSSSSMKDQIFWKA